MLCISISLKLKLPIDVVTPLYRNISLHLLNITVQTYTLQRDTGTNKHSHGPAKVSMICMPVKTWNVFDAYKFNVH